MAATNIIDVTVRRVREGSGEGKGKNKSSETWGISPLQISQIRPSVCLKDGVTDGLTNAEVILKAGEGAGFYGNVTRLWVSETEAAIKTLTNS